MSSQFDATIPVLTEVFSDAPAPAPAQPEAALEQRAVAGFSAADWELLERRLSERILNQLQSRIDFVLEQRVRDAMGEVLQRALKGLSAEFSAGLHVTLETIVSRAVTQEITHLQALKK